MRDQCGCGKHTNRAAPTEDHGSIAGRVERLERAAGGGQGTAAEHQKRLTEWIATLPEDDLLALAATRPGEGRDEVGPAHKTTADHTPELHRVLADGARFFAERGWAWAW